MREPSLEIILTANPVHTSKLTAPSNLPELKFKVRGAVYSLFRFTLLFSFTSGKLLIFIAETAEVNALLADELAYALNDAVMASSS